MYYLRRYSLPLAILVVAATAYAATNYYWGGYYFTFDEQAAPSAPPAGKVAFYAKTGAGEMCSLSSASVETCMSAGGGGGGGEANTASNLGGGLANFSTKVGVDLRFNSFASADFDLASNLITIDDTKWATDADVLLKEPIYTVTVSSGSTGAGTAFVGTVTCATVIPTSGTVNACEADVSSFGTEALVGGSIHLIGKYVIATPAQVSGGFEVQSALFKGNGGGCTNNPADDCGTEFTNFMTSAHALGILYNGVYKEEPVIKFLPGHVYASFNGINPGKYIGAGWHLDHTSKPHFESYSNMASATRSLPGTGTVTVATDPAILLMSSSICPGATCYDGTQLVNTGDVLKFGAVTWENAGVGHPGTQQKAIVLGIVDSTHIKIAPSFESDLAASAVEDGYASIIVFDNVSTTAPGAAREGGVNKIDGEAQIDCQNKCQNINTLTTGTKRTVAGGYRQVPLQLLITRYSPLDGGFGLATACGKDDSFFTSTYATVTPDQSTSGGRFFHHISGCGDWNEFGWQAVGADPNSAQDDGIGSAVRLLASNFYYEPPAVTSGFGRFLFAAGNCSISHFNMRTVEEAAQLAWLPSGCEQMEWDGASDEHFTFCNVGGKADCGVNAARRPWIVLGALHDNAGDLLTNELRFNFANLSFQGRPITFLKVEDTHHTRIQLNGHVEHALAMFDIANNETQIYGDMLCFSGTAGACDRPALGNWDDFIMFDPNGMLWTGRKPNSVAITVDFGATGAFDATATVSAQSWVSATSRIVCSPTMMSTADRPDGSDDVLLDQVTVAAFARVPTVGFTVKAHAPNRAFGKFLVHCVGA